MTGAEISPKEPLVADPASVLLPPVSPARRPSVNGLGGESGTVGDLPLEEGAVPYTQGMGTR